MPRSSAVAKKPIARRSRAVVEEEEVVKTPKKTRSNGHAADPANAWQAMLDELQSGASGPNFFLKAGKTRIRLIPEPGTEDDETPTFFVPVTSSYRGKERPKYLLSAVVLGAEGRELREDQINTVIPVVVPKSVLQDILNNLASGWDLFDLMTGHGISIMKSGSGLNTDYNVTMSPKPIPLIEEPNPMNTDGEPITLADAAIEFQKRSAQRAATEAGKAPNEDDAEEEAAPSRGARRASPRSEGW